MATTTQKILEQSLCTFHAFPSNFQNFFVIKTLLFWIKEQVDKTFFSVFDKLLFLVLKREFLQRGVFMSSLLSISWVMPQSVFRLLLWWWYVRASIYQKIQRAMAASKRASWEGHTPSIKAHISKEVITWPAFAFYHFVLSGTNTQVLEVRCRFIISNIILIKNCKKKIPLSNVIIATTSHYIIHHQGL